MAEAYVTFKGTTTGLSDAFYPTQALADARATDADITAVQGVQTIPSNFRPNKAYWDGSELLEEIPELVIFNALSEVEKLKAGFQAFHDALIRGSTFLETPDIKLYYPDADRQIAHDMLALTHRACRGVGLSTHWTSQQKFAWLLAMAAGPTDVGFESGPLTAAERFFEVVEEARNGENPIVAPTAYFMWAHPDDAVRWGLSAVATTLADTIIDNFAEATTDFTIFRNGSWIADITV